MKGRKLCKCVIINETQKKTFQMKGRKLCKCVIINETKQGTELQDMWVKYSHAILSLYKQMYQHSWIKHGLNRLNVINHNGKQWWWQPLWPQHTALIGLMCLIPLGMNYVYILLSPGHDCCVYLSWIYQDWKLMCYDWVNPSSFNYTK